MRPHKVHVSQGGEYNGETYIYCECVTPEGEKPVGMYGNRRGIPGLFDGLFEGEGTEALIAWLREHDEIPPEHCSSCDGMWCT
jgi:hypothetical protein